MTEQGPSGDATPEMPDRAADPPQDVGSRPYGIYECETCDNVALTLYDGEEGMICHGEPMQQVTEVGIDVQPPDVREVLLNAFGLPKPGLDICLCVIGEGPLPPADVATELGYDESTVRTYLNRLVELGLLQKSQLNREDGGIVNVYHSIDLEQMRRETLLGFYAWAGEAVSLVEEANLTKAAYLAEDHEKGLDEIFWERFDGDS
jgi:predicted transcriptional regulator